MVATGDSQVRTFLQNLSSARSSFPSRLADDTPVLQRGAAPEFQPQVGIEPASSALQREV